MPRSNQIPQYTAGTISIANVSGVWTVIGVGTNFLSPDGVTNWTIAVGDRLICGGVEGRVNSIISATQLTLAPWYGSAVAAGASYAIDRFSGNAPGTLAGLIANLLALGSTANPFAALSAYTSTGAGKINLGDDGAGDALLQIRPSSGSDSSYVTALKINETTGLVTFNAPTVSLILSAYRTKCTSAPTMLVDPLLGTDGPGQGLGWGSAACATLAQAQSNIATQYDLQGFRPTIQGAGPNTAGGGVAARTFTPTLNLVGDQGTPGFVGSESIMIDLGGSYWTTSGGNCNLYVRNFPCAISFQNAVMQITGSGGYGNNIHVFGSELQITGPVTFAGNPSGQAAVLARNRGHIATAPGSNIFNITGGGGSFLGVTSGGRIEWEGTIVNIGASGISYNTGFINAIQGENISVVGTCFTGSYNITGQQYNASKRGMIDIVGQVAGQVINFAGIGNVTSNDYRTGSFNSGLVTGYLPGTIAGTMGPWEGWFSDPGSPVINFSASSGIGTAAHGAVVQLYEPAFVIVLGSDAATSGSATLVIEFATTTPWNNVMALPQVLGAFTNWQFYWLSPTSTAPGVLTIEWTATAYSAGQGIIVKCGG